MKDLVQLKQDIKDEHGFYKGLIKDRNLLLTQLSPLVKLYLEKIKELKKPKESNG